MSSATDPHTRSAEGTSGMRLPSPRGTLTTALFPALRGIGPFPVDELVTLVCDADSGGAALEDDDVHTALWAAYQLHYTGFDDVDDRWEWDPDLLRLRRALEDRFLAELRFRTADIVQDDPGGGGVRRGPSVRDDRERRGACPGGVPAPGRDAGGDARAPRAAQHPQPAGVGPAGVRAAPGGRAGRRSPSPSCCTTSSGPVDRSGCTARCSPAAWRSAASTTSPARTCPSCPASPWPS